MCDYSLHLVRSRPAKVGDKLVTTKFNNSITHGFAEVGGDQRSAASHGDHFHGMCRVRPLIGVLEQKLGESRSVPTIDINIEYHHDASSSRAGKSCCSTGCAKASTRRCCNCQPRCTSCLKRKSRSTTLASSDQAARLHACSCKRENRLIGIVMLACGRWRSRAG